MQLATEIQHTYRNTSVIRQAHLLPKSLFLATFSSQDNALGRRGLCAPTSDNVFIRVPFHPRRTPLTLALYPSQNKPRTAITRQINKEVPQSSSC